MKLRNTDVPLMLASLALSLFLWVVVQVQLGAKSVVLQVRLQPTNKPENVSVGGAPTTVDVETVATQEQSEWLQDHKSELFASVDLKGLGPGNYNLPVVFHHPPADDLSFQLKGRTVLVRIEKYVTRRILVKVRLKSDLPTEKLAWVRQIVRPVEVEVSGPEGLVSIAEAWVEIDRSHYQENMQMQPLVKLVDAHGEPLEDLRVDPETVTITPIVEPVKTVAIVPLKFKGQPETGFHLGFMELSLVQVRGPSKVLEGLKSIQLPAVDLSGRHATAQVSLKPILPQGVSLLHGDTVEVTIPIEQDMPVPATSSNTPPTSTNSKGNTVP